MCRSSNMYCGTTQLKQCEGNECPVSFLQRTAWCSAREEVLDIYFSYFPIDPDRPCRVEGPVRRLGEPSGAHGVAEPCLF